MTREPDVMVVGGGLAGLAAAATAARAGARVTMLEGHDLGGRARSVDSGGYRFNLGAHAVYNAGPGARVLATLGVTVTGGPPNLADARVLYAGRTRPLPGSTARMLASRLLSVRTKLAVGSLLRALPSLDATAYAHVSAAAWLRSLDLGDDGLAFVTMLVRTATYVDPLVQPLSADAAIAQLQLALGAGVTYADGGWQRLVDGLRDAARTAGAQIITGTVVRRVVGDDHDVVVETPDRAWRAGAVVVAAGSPAAATAVLEGDVGAVGPEGTVACLDLGVRRPPSPAVLLSMDDPIYLSTHAPPADLAPAGRAVVCLLRYGARTAADDRAALRARAAADDRASLRARAALAGINDDDIDIERFLHRMVAVSAMPVADHGGRAGRPAIDAVGVPGVYLAGDWVGPDGMLADASLASGEAAGTAAAAHIRASALGRR